jgi:uncharacterized protein (TIGR02391 family)
MNSDQLEIRLRSITERPDWEYEVTLRIVAYLEESDEFGPNTFIFYCDPMGNNCSRTYLKVEFPNPEAIASIQQFLSHHLQKDDKIERTCRVPVVDGERANTWDRGSRNKIEGITELQVMADSERISFGPLGSMTPDIRFHERATKEGGPQDQRNGHRLLNFFEEVIESQTGYRSVTLHDDELVNRCLPLFKDEKYPEAARLAGQILEERVTDFAPESHADFGGAKLMRETFSPDGGPLQIASDGGEQAGLMSLFAGTYQAIRNPLSHRTPERDRERYLDDLDEIQTRNILHIADYLLTTLERHQGRLKE